MIFFFDCETSGLDPDRHGILQIAWIIDDGGDIKQEKCYDVKLEGDHDICLAALDCNNFSLERIRKGTPLGRVMSSLRISLLDAGCMNDQGIPCGHNVPFDISFLQKAEDITDEKVLMYLQWWKSLDTLAFARWLYHTGKLTVSEHKLQRLCEHFNIEHDPHDAYSDVRAVRQIYYIFKRMLESK